MNEESQKNCKKRPIFSFFTLITLALITAQIPFLHIPFSWMQTFFHEVSHGLIAILTGGKIISIELNLNGSGRCTSQGGMPFFISISGYIGAVLWGGLIYMIVGHIKDKNAFIIALFIISLILFSMIFWARDSITFFVLMIMLSPFIIALKMRSIFVEKYLLQFSGIYIMLDALTSPLHLVQLHSRGDDVILEAMTGLPQWLWVFIWFGLGILMFFILVKMQLRKNT